MRTRPLPCRPGVAVPILYYFTFMCSLYFSVHVCFSYQFSSCLFTGVQNSKPHAISHPQTLIITSHTQPLAWFRVEEYSGLTGRKGTTVVSVTRVLWFCVASQTSRRKRARDRISSHLRGHGSAGRHGSHTVRETWGSTLRSPNAQKYTSKSTHGLRGQ